MKTARRHVVLSICLCIGLSLLVLGAPPVPVHGRKNEGNALLTPSERQWLNRHADDIVVAPTPNYPPVDFFNDDGAHSGIAADILAQIEKRLGVRFTRKQLKSWHEIIAQAKARTIDVTTIAQRTPRREKFWLFTKPYLEVPTVIVAREDSPDSLSLGNLHDLDVAIVKGYAIDEYLDRHHPGLSLTPVPDDLTGLQKLSFGEFDAMIADLPTASYLISKWGITNLRIAGNTGHKYHYAIASRNDRPVLNQILGKALAAIPAEKRRAIVDRWITMEHRAFPWVKTAVVIGLLIFFLTAFFIWNRILHQRVRHRTRALERSESQFKALFDASPYALMVSDITGRLLMVNPAFEAISGRKAAEAVGRTADELDFFTDPCVNAPTRQKFRAKGRLDNLEIPFKAADGSEGVLMYSSRLIRFGKQSAVLAIAFDISESRRDQEALREKEQQLRSLAAHLPGLVYQFYATPDDHWEISYVSEGSEEMLGISYEPEGFFERFLSHIDPRDQEAFIESIREAVAKASHWEFEGRFTKPSGDLLWFRGLSSPFRNGETLVFNGILLDITQQKQTEAQLRQAQHMESVGRLAAGVAHDFNNMLSPILGYAEMLMKEFDADDRRITRLQQIVSAADRARHLTHQLLAYGRRQTLSVKPVDLNTLITGMQELMRRTLRENIELRIHACPDNCFVRADANQVEQILMNLMINAQEAMPYGGELTIEAEKMTLAEKSAARPGDLEPGPYGVLTVSDTGHGMDDQTRERIFEPFFSTKGNLDYGLGLATVHGIVKQHGGTIEVDSAPGRGTVFTIFLPATTETAADVETPAEAASDVTRGTETILIVEDNEMVRHLAHSALKQQGYTVYAADAGQAALGLIESQNVSPDLLLTDVILPHMDGKTLYQRISAKVAGIRVLYISGYPHDIIAHHGVLDNNIDFLQKPFSIHQLATRVRELLDRDRR